jgi:hypothetical protein
MYNVRTDVCLVNIFDLSERVCIAINLLCTGKKHFEYPAEALGGDFGVFRRRTKFPACFGIDFSLTAV